MNQRVPTLFFLLTFIWSWVIWAPLVLAGLEASSLAGHRRSCRTRVVTSS
jgi:hypothetical protein